MAEQLNHHNPEYVTWKYEEILFTLLGGIRIEGLHSMRVTLKIDFKTFPSIPFWRQCSAGSLVSIKSARILSGVRTIEAQFSKILFH